MKYTLMNKDKVVISFETNHTATDKIVVVNTIVEDKNLIPLDYTGKIKSYINNRKAPKHRKYIEQLLNELNANNIEGYIKLCNAASLNDTFWIKSEENNKGWDDVSLYKNEFDENIAKLALDGGNNAVLVSTSPEFSTNGRYAKCWIRENNDLFLIKRGSSSYGGREVSAEYYSSQIMNIICNNSVSYELEMYHGKPATKCKIFTSEKEGYSSISNFYNYRFGTEAVDLIEEISQFDSEDNYRRMVIGDALITNIDRHLGNFGYTIDNDNLKILNFAPTFDFNRTMFFHLNNKDFMKTRLEDVLISSFNDGNLLEDAKDMLTDSIKNDLKNFKGFQFKRNDISDWSQERLNKYEAFMDDRINKILCISKEYNINFTNNMPELVKTDEGRKLSQAEELTKSSQSKDKE